MPAMCGGQLPSEGMMKLEQWFEDYIRKLILQKKRTLQGCWKPFTNCDIIWKSEDFMYLPDWQTAWG